MATLHCKMILALFFLLALVTPTRAQTGCCSLRELTCNSTFGTSYQSCMSQSWDVGKLLVWYPTGIPNPLPNCTRAKRTCTTHTECCGPNVCSGLGRDFKSRRQCNHPQDVCKSFRDPSLSVFCESRPECRWQAATLTMNATCVPDFNYTFVNSATKPLNIIDEEGCCSDDHQTCHWNKWNLTTPALCTASSAASVWLRNGTIVNSTCYSTNTPIHCTKNSQCCGTLVCAAVSSNPVDVKCRAPSTVCPTFTSNSTTGIARCNAAPGCIWQANRCIVSFDATIFNTTYVTNVKPTIKEPTLVKSQLDGNPDRLGLCTGFVAHMHGDPHFNSFDRNYYNCMGTGAFVLAKAPGMMEIQGLFYQAGGGKASVARGIAIDYPMLPGVPRIQISMNETADRADPTTYMINNDCAAHIFLDGELKNAQRNHSYSSTQQTYAMRFTSSGAVEIQFFNNKQNSTAIQISVSGAPNGTFGCYMSVRTCLPLNEPELRNKTVGLLGTPNGNMEDEWKASNGTVVPVSGVPEEQYKYCTSQHCVMTRPQSLFIYEGKSFKDLWSCNAEFPGEPDLTTVPQAVLDICKGRQDCVLEGVLGGINEAVRNVQENNLIVAIQVSNKTVEAVKFDITPPVEDDCKWPRTGANSCPGDVALLNYPATPLPLFVQSPVNIVSQKGNTVTFNISNPFNSKMQAMYYQYYDVNSPKCLAKANLTECIKPVTVTATCMSGRNANHTATLKFTTVDFWFVDPTVIKPADNFTVPACCQPASKDVKVPTTLLTYRVFCETSCPLSTAKRHLRSSS